MVKVGRQKKCGGLFSVLDETPKTFHQFFKFINRGRNLMTVAGSGVSKK